jgi:uncharacterized delta-60 repeat protein
MKRLRRRLFVESLDERIVPAGMLDPTFGTGGATDINFNFQNSSADAILRQPDGKYVVVGSLQGGGFAVARLNTDGTLDNTFGTGGEVVTNFGNGVQAHAAALEGNQIVVVGQSSINNGDVALARYNSDGSLDNNFGNNGTVDADFGEEECGTGVAIVGNQILVGGTSNVPFGASYFALWRFNSDGSVDTSFGTNGQVTTDVGSKSGQGQSLAVLSGGDVLLAGFNNRSTCVVRYLSNGTVDASFGTGGIATASIPNMQANNGHCMYVEPDGSILVGGDALGLDTNGYVDLVRFTSGGALDTTFNGTGMETFLWAPGGESDQSLAVQPNGKILMGGFLLTHSFLARLNSDGSLDSTFGTGGLLTVALDPAQTDSLNAILLQSDDQRLVGVGTMGLDSGAARFFTLNGPILANVESTPLSYDAGQAPTDVTNTMTLTDEQSATINGATVSITAGFASAEDVLGFTNQNGITGSYNSATGVLTLTGTASVADYQTALESVTYANTNVIPDTTTRTVTFQVDDGVAGNNLSNTQSRDIDVGGHLAPVLANIETTTLSYTEGTSARLITTALTVSDSDSANISGATIWISNNFAGAEDFLGFVNHNGITGSYNSATGVLTLSGTATVAAYQAALRNVFYTDKSGNPSTATRTVSFQVDDGFGANNLSNIQSRDISITAVNTPPTLTIPVDGPVGGTNLDISLLGISVGDVDSNGGIEDLTLSVSDGNIRFNSLTGVTVDGGANNSPTLTVGGTINQLNAALAGSNLVYHSNAAFIGADTLDLTINDNGNTGTGGPKSTSGSMTITVSNHVAPVLSKIETTPLAFTEGNSPKNVTSSLTVTDSDSTTLSGATIWISNNFAGTEDVLGFTSQSGVVGVYNSSTGVLTLSGTATVAQYQSVLHTVTYWDTSLNPSTATRTISFQVNDGAIFSNLSNIVSRNVSVSAVNSAPVLTVPVNGPTGSTDTDIPVNGVVASDVDGNAGLESLTLSVQNGTIRFNSLAGISVVSGANNSKAMTVQGTIANLETALSSGNLIYHSKAGYQGSDTLNLTLNDDGNTGSGGAKTVSKSLSIHIVHSPPVLANIEGSTLGFTEGDSAMPITNTLTVSDSDSLTIAGATVTISAGYVKGEDLFGFANQDGITGSFNSSSGVLTLSGTASVADYQSALRSVTYVDNSLDPSTAARTVTFQVNDGASSNNHSNTQSRSVAVTAVNTPPSLTVPANGPSGIQNLDIVVSGVSTADVDANGGQEDLTLAVSNGAIRFVSLSGLIVDGGANNSATVTVRGTIAQLNSALAGTNLVYRSNPLVSGTETLSLSLNDNGNTGTGGPQTLSKNVSITVMPHIAPVLSKIETTALAFTEGNSAKNITSALTATDSDSAALVGATVWISNNFASGEDVLGFANQNGITGNYDGSTGVLTLSGTATTAQYQSALRSVTYRDSSQNPSTATRTISFRVNDGAAQNNLSNVATRNVTVTAVNNAPQITVPPTAPSGSKNTDIVINGISVADIDGNSGVENLTLTVKNGTVRFVSLAGITVISGGNNTKTMTVQGSIAALTVALSGGNLIYHSNSIFTGSDTLSLTLNDNGNTGTGGAKSASGSLQIHVS